MNDTTFKRRGKAKTDCAMYRDEGSGEYCAGLTNLDCCWGECSFYKSKETFDYGKALNDIRDYGSKE